MRRTTVQSRTDPSPLSSAAKQPRPVFLLVFSRGNATTMSPYTDGRNYFTIDDEEDKDNIQTGPSSCDSMK
jgi:hypothetical protein